jgi:nitroreductase
MEELFMMVIEAIRKRRSIRKFTPGAVVTDEQIKLLLEAAMLAPSACNTRPWEFFVVKDREKLDQIRKIHPYTGMLETATLAIVVVALPDAQENVRGGLPLGYYPQDCGAATQNILLQAVELGLGTCWCGVYPKKQLMDSFAGLFNIAEPKIPFNIIAVGTPDESPAQRGSFEESKVTYIE